MNVTWRALEHVKAKHMLEYNPILMIGHKHVSDGMANEVTKWLPPTAPSPKHFDLQTRYNLYQVRNASQIQNGTGVLPPLLFHYGPSPEPIPSSPSTENGPDAVAPIFFEYDPLPPVLIHAPTGSGKNWFILNTVADTFSKYGYNILVLTNRKPLCEQQRMEADKKNGLVPMDRSVYEKYPFSDNIIIETYQNAISFLEETNDNFLNTIAAVVFDEAHFFASDSTYNPNTSIILQRLLNRFFWSKRIYMSATPEDVKPLIAVEELRALMNAVASKCGRVLDFDTEIDIIQILKSRANLPKIDEFIFPNNFDNVNFHFFHSWDSIKSKIASEYKEEQTFQSDKQLNKWLIFRQTKEEGKIFKEELGPCANYVNAERNKENGKKLQKIIQKRKFHNKVLISTTVLYNGVSLVDDSLKNIVVDSLLLSEVIQMLGRKRCKEGETVNLYIRVPSIEEIESKIDYCSKIFSSTDSFRKAPEKFIREKYQQEKFDLSLRQLIGPQQGKQGAMFGLSQFAQYQIAIESGQYSSLISDYDEEDEFFLEKKICESWFGKDFTKDMFLGETHAELRERIAEVVLSYVEQYAFKSPFPVSICEELWSKLINIVEPIRKSEMKFSPKHHLKEMSEEERMHVDKAAKFGSLLQDIRKIIEYFQLPYTISKGDRACELQYKALNVIDTSSMETE